MLCIRVAIHLFGAIYIVVGIPSLTMCIVRQVYENSGNPRFSIYDLQSDEREGPLCRWDLGLWGIEDGHCILATSME